MPRTKDTQLREIYKKFNKLRDTSNILSEQMNPREKRQLESSFRAIQTNIDYIKKEVLVADIPFSRTANNFCDSLNKEGERGVAQLTHHVRVYHKHMNDIMFYKHTIRTSKDTTKVFTAGVRMQDSLGMVKEAKHHLAFY